MSITANNQTLQPGLFDEIPTIVIQPRKTRKTNKAALPPYELRRQAIRKVETAFIGYVTLSTMLQSAWENKAGGTDAEKQALKSYDRSAVALRSLIETALGLGVPMVDLVMAVADAVADDRLGQLAAADEETAEGEEE